MQLRALVLSVLGVVLVIVSGCGGPELLLDIKTKPRGAEVYLSRSGEKCYKGAFGPVAGDVEAEPFSEDFRLLGTTPVRYASPLEEHESGGTVFGVGLSRVRRYDEGILRIEKDGFETIERRVRFTDGKLDLDLKLRSASGAGAAAE